MKYKGLYPGQTLVEFALVIPILLLLMLGFFDLGRAVFFTASLSNAVREGARFGIVRSYDEKAIEDEVKNFLFAMPNVSTHLTIESVPTEDATGFYFQTLQVNATYCFVPITPGIKGIIGNGCNEGAVQGIELTAESEMQFEPGIGPTQ